MLIHTLIRLNTVSLMLSYVMCTTAQQQSQLTALHERVNQMLSELYSSPLISKLKVASEETPPPTPESTSGYSLPPAPAPQVVFVSPPSYVEGAQPTEYRYSLPSPVPRPAYSFDFYSQLPPYSSSLSRAYPEYPRSYPQLPSPQSVSFPPFSQPSYAPYPYPSPAPYGFSSYSGSPVSPSPYLSQGVYRSYPGPASQHPPALPYPPPALSPYSSLTQQYALSPFPSATPYPSPVPFPSPAPLASMPAPYLPSLSYPQPLYPQPVYPPPAFPRPSDILPPSQYEYSS